MHNPTGNTRTIRKERMVIYLEAEFGGYEVRLLQRRNGESPFVVVEKFANGDTDEVPFVDVRKAIDWFAECVGDELDEIESIDPRVLVLD